MLRAVRGRQRARAPHVPARRAQALLALGVLALAAAIVLLPSLLAGRADTVAGQPPAARELVEAAIHRFDQPPLDRGVLHEQYRVERAGQPAHVIDRWYDYAAPHRLAITVREDGERGRPRAQISSDGRSLVQLRFGRDGRRWGQAVDARVTEAEAQSVLPLLRGQPLASAFARDPSEPGDLGPLYLAQARAANASFLGQTTMLGRPAYLLTYRTSQLPDQPPWPEGGQPAQVVLTIDAQTYALLDVAVLPEGVAEGAARHPVQALQVELLESVPDDRFYLPSSPEVAQQDSVASVRFPYLQEELFLSLNDAARRSGSLLAPQQLPDERMRGLAVAVSLDAAAPVALLYEGEFQNLIVMPGSPEDGMPTEGEERSAGAFRYRIVEQAASGGLVAFAYRPDTPEQRVMLILNDELSTDAERVATLEALIGSLTTVDTQTLPILRRNFHSPRAAAGRS
jgi:hypothetical protein